MDAKYATEAGYFQNAFPNSNIVVYGPGDPTCIHKAGESLNIGSLLQYEKELFDVLNGYSNYASCDKIDVKRVVHTRKKYY